MWSLLFSFTSSKSHSILFVRLHFKNMCTVFKVTSVTLCAPISFACSGGQFSVKHKKMRCPTKSKDCLTSNTSLHANFSDPRKLETLHDRAGRAEGERGGHLLALAGGRLAPSRDMRVPFSNPVVKGELFSLRTNWIRHKFSQTLSVVSANKAMVWRLYN